MSDALVISYIPGYTFSEGEIVTIDKLNELARPTINLAGTVGSTLIADNSITTVKLVDGILTADATGRAKMQDGYFSADATGRGKFEAGFFGAGDSQSLDLFEDGFWTATDEARAKFAPGFFDSTLISANAAPTIGSSRNLVMQNNSGTPNSQVDMAADEITLKNSDGAPYVALAVSVTVDITVSGANGLDTGTEATNAWYYLYVIAKDDGTVAGLLSTSSTAPTLPSGYTFKTLAGTVRNNGSGNFESFLQFDRDKFINDSAFLVDKTGVTSWTAVSGTDLTTLQGILPPIAKVAWGNAGNQNGQDGAIGIGADANGLGASVVSAQHGPGTVLSYGPGGTWKAPLKTAQTLYYIMGATTAHWRASVTGYRI